MSQGGFNALENASNEANQSMSCNPAGMGMMTCGTAGPDSTVIPEKTHWIAIELVDEMGKHVPYEEYVITLPDGTEVGGTLDKSGRAKVKGIDPGNCRVSFPNMDKEVWDRK